MKSSLSIVVPCFNEEQVIENTFQRLQQAVEQIQARFDLDSELVFVDDGSRDATLTLLHQIQATHSSPTTRVKVIALARNFGHQIALTAGLSRASGDAAVAIDADLQDPPEVIEIMVEQWLAGADVVYGHRLSRAGESRFKIVTAHLFYKLVKGVTGVDIPPDTGDFRLISRRVLDIFNSMPERSRFVRGMIPWVGFKQVPVSYHRSARLAGETKYPLSKMVRLAFDGITSFSNAPLQTAYSLGLMVAVVCAGYGLWIIFKQLAYGYPVQGWSSLMVTMLFMGSVQLMTIGILGDYIGRIYDEVKQRPLFVIDERSSQPETAGK